MVSRLRRALFFTGAVMIWERLLPALTPLGLWAAAVLVAGQWGLWQRLPFAGHAALLGVGLLAALWAGALFLKGFRRPSFTETNQRLALDNRLRPERLLALRHEKHQPRLRTGKARAGVAAGDPFALRYVLLLAAAFGLWVSGPVSLSQVVSGFAIVEKAPQVWRF